MDIPVDTNEGQSNHAHNVASSISFDIVRFPDTHIHSGERGPHTDMIRLSVPRREQLIAMEKQG